MPFCRNCGKEVPLNARFCRNCGKPITLPKTAAPQPQPAPVQPAAPQPQPAPVQPAEPQPQPAPAQPAAPQPQPAPVQPAASQPQPAPVQPTEPQSQPAPVQPAASQPQPAPVQPAAPQPQPAPVQPAAPQPQPAPIQPAEPQPTKKKNKAPLIIITIVLLLAGVGAALWFFVFNKKDEPKTEVAEGTSAVVQQPETTTQPVQPEPTSVEEPALAEDPAPVEMEPAPVEEPMKGTKEAPVDADFSSWYIGKAQVKGMPRNVSALTTLDDVQGGWKALLFQDPKNTYGVKAYTLANVIIAGEGSDLTFTIKRHNTRFLTTNETIDEEKELDDVFNARWDNGKLNASGAGSLTLTSFWEQDGKQYAIGTFDSPDGIPVSFGMVRP